ncbi:Ca2+ regulator and membrane fusion protein Fig1-domain-containing protein, partial [Dichotomopilus funicola]
NLAAILLAGCTANGLSNFHLLSLSYNASGALPIIDDTITSPNTSSSIATLLGKGAAFQIRVGYFGYCLLNNGTTFCSTDLPSLASLIRQSNSSDPGNLFYIAKRFHDDTIFSGLILISIIFSAMCFMLLSTFPSWHTEEDSDDGSEREVKPFPSRVVSDISLLLVLVSSLLALVAALWQHLSTAATSTMIGTLTYGSVSGEVGVGATVLGWVSTGLLCVVTVALLVMVLSIRILNQIVA